MFSRLERVQNPVNACNTSAIQKPAQQGQCHWSQSTCSGLGKFSRGALNQVPYSGCLSHTRRWIAVPININSHFMLPRIALHKVS